MIVHYENSETRSLTQVERRIAWVEQLHLMIQEHKQLLYLAELFPLDQKKHLEELIESKKADLLEELSRLPYLQ